jgi:hypothetical protein
LAGALTPCGSVSMARQLALPFSRTCASGCIVYCGSEACGA